MRRSRRGSGVENEIPFACTYLHLGNSSVKTSVIRVDFTGGVNGKAEETTNHHTTL